MSFLPAAAARAAASQRAHARSHKEVCFHVRLIEMMSWENETGISQNKCGRIHLDRQMCTTHFHLEKIVKLLLLLCILFSESLQYNIILYNLQNRKTEKV